MNIEKKEDSKRYIYIDWLETIAIFFVLVYHSSLWSADLIINPTLIQYIKYFLNTILSTCVPIFFFANGFLLFSKKFDLKKHIIKIIRIISLSLLWEVILLFVQVKTNHLEIAFKEVMKILWSWQSGVIDILWFLGALVCIYIIFPIIKNVFDTNKRIFIYFVIVSFIFTFGNVFINESFTLLYNIIFHKNKIICENFFNIFNPFRGIYAYSFVYFCMGGICYMYIDKIQLIAIKISSIIAVLSLSLSCTGLFFLGIIFSKIQMETWDVVWYGYDSIFTFFNVFIIFLLSLKIKNKVRIIRIISENTLGIYFTHGILLFSTRMYFRQEIDAFNLPMGLVYSLMIMVLCLGVCFIIKKIPILRCLI